MHEARDIRDGDKMILTVPLRVESSGLWGTKVLNGEAVISILVREHDGKFDLIVADPVVRQA